MPLDDLLLPGESKLLQVQNAEDLAAVDACDGVLGALITTPHGHALSTTCVLEVREVRKQEVGAQVDVVATGRVQLPAIETGRYFEGRGVSTVCDTDECTETLLVEHHADQLYGGWSREDGRRRRRLEQQALDERIERMRGELCVWDLDRPAAAAELNYGVPPCCKLIYRSFGG